MLRWLWGKIREDVRIKVEGDVCGQCGEPATGPDVVFSHNRSMVWCSPEHQADWTAADAW